MTLFGLKFPVFNASGPRSVTVEELLELGKSHSGAILLKSTTKLPRAGNEKPRYFEDNMGSINSMGLPNLGPEAYIEIIPQLRAHKKPIIASVSGMKPEDYLPICRKFLDASVDGVEINLSCPNIIGKPQVAFDFETSKNILQQIKEISKKTPIGVKLPPYPDPIFNQKMAEIIKELKIDFITTINSVPHCSIIDIEREEFVIKNKFGGLGGDYVKPVALGQVARFYELLEGKVPIIGCGGIKSGKDVIEFFLAGASAVQVGTQLMREGTSAFERIEKELEIELRKKKCEIRDLIGRAKPRLEQIRGMLDY